MLPSFVRSFLDSNPPRLVWGDSLDNLPELKSPSLFSERHLDAQLTLRQVRIIPLEEFLSQVVDHTLGSIEEKGISLRKMGPDEVFKERPSKGTLGVANDAESVANAYRDSTSQYCRALAPHLLFYPRGRQWSTHCLCLKRMKPEGGSYHAASLDCYGLHIFPSSEISKNLRRFMDEGLCEMIDALNERYESLAWWETFYLDEEIKGLFEEFDNIASAGEFNGSCSTTGFGSPPAGNVHVPPDASNTPWITSISSSGVQSTSGDQLDTPMVSGNPSRLKTSNAIPAASLASLPHRSKEQRKKQPPETPTVQKLNDDSAPWPEVQLKNQRPQQLILFILRAWGQSVNDDTTFMIFRCGNYERIGFRHRESQTLFMSSLIDIPNCNPTYNRIHTGLYISIIQDALDRLTQERSASEAKPRKRKRKRDSCDAGVPSRLYKTRSRALKDVEEAHNFELLKQQVLARPLALITLRFGNYNSIAPGAFLRSGASKHSSYGPDEYISLVLTSKIGYGAIGTIYLAHMELLVESRARSTTVVVKVASQEKDIEHLQHEYSIYEHLSRHGVVEGIPFVFGLFKDTE
ncbi:hypothetical protein H0H93_010055, partial [Arthromyces matolae]